MATRRDALAARREALGYTQEGLAQELGVELSTIGRWERGTLTPQPWRRTVLARVLGVSLQELNELLTPASEQPALATEVDREFVSPRCPPASTAAALPVGSLDHLDELLVHLREQWHTLVRADNLLGPRFALAGVLDQISIIEELLPRCTGSPRVELVKLAATYAESAAWLHEDAAQMPAAAFWVGRAMEWAHEAGDELMLAWTLFRRSQQAAAARDPQRTISLAQAAGRREDLLPNPMRAAIAQQEAHGYALAGEETLSHRTLDAAHRWAALDSAGDARAGHGSFCTETYLELQRAHCWAALGKPDRAVKLYEAVLPALPPVYRRDRGTAGSRFAQAQVSAGQFEAAASTAREALTIARSAGSVRTEHEVVFVGQRLQKHRALEPVRELLREISNSPAA
ncbi:helix-turn-helix domain-containing protein [Amycolatopsis sp. NPDC058986]|uniref:helix-turn-helix domain-containing protein n=1 Tax=unclassified Amycolatopsis TaxID=2618356 RepID=UPI00367269AA